MTGTTIKLSKLSLGLLVAFVSSALFARDLPATTEDTFRLGGKVGYTNIEKMETGTMSVGLNGDYAPANNFLVGVTLDYWREDFAIEDGRNADVSDLALGANTKLVFTNTKAPFRPFVLAGVAGHRIGVKESRETTTDDPAVDVYEDEFSDAEGQFGVDLGVGVLYRVKEQVDINAEVRWRNIFEDTVEYDQVAFTSGLAYLL